MVLVSGGAAAQSGGPARQVGGPSRQMRRWISGMGGPASMPGGSNRPQAKHGHGRGRHISVLSVPKRAEDVREVPCAGAFPLCGHGRKPCGGHGDRCRPRMAARAGNKNSRHGTARAGSVEEGKAGDDAAYFSTPSSLPTLMNASMHWSSCPRSWPAEICTRMRASPLGTTG